MGLMRSSFRAERAGVVRVAPKRLFRRDLPQLEERLPLVRFLRARFLVRRPEPRRPFADTPEGIPGTEHRRAGSELAYPRERDTVVAHLVERSDRLHTAGLDVAEVHGDLVPHQPDGPISVVYLRRLVSSPSTPRGDGSRAYLLRAR